MEIVMELNDILLLNMTGKQYCQASPLCSLSHGNCSVRIRVRVRVRVRVVLCAL